MNFTQYASLIDNKIVRRITTEQGTNFGIWRRLHGMTPRTRHAVYTARAAADLSRVTDRRTDRLTDTANIGNNSQHLMHSMQPNKIVSNWLLLSESSSADTNVIYA